MPETIKLFGSTKFKTTRDRKGENVSHLEITEVVLVHCNIVNKDYQHNLRVHICSKQILWSIITHFTKNIYIFKNL